VHNVNPKRMSGWFSKDPVAAAKKQGEKEAKAVLQLRELLGSEEGQQAAHQLVQGEQLDVLSPPCNQMPSVARRLLSPWLQTACLLLLTRPRRSCYHASMLVYALGPDNTYLALYIITSDWQMHWLCRWRAPVSRGLHNGRIPAPLAVCTRVGRESDVSVHH
jgi:hypothetical protein